MAAPLTKGMSAADLHASVTASMGAASVGMKEVSAAEGGGGGKMGDDGDSSGMLDILMAPEDIRIAVRTGFLWKKGQKHRNWRRRFFVLYAGKWVDYYKSPEDVGERERLGRVPLESATVSEVETGLKEAGTAREWGFQLHSPLNYRTYILRADSEAERAEWMSDFAAVVEGRAEAGGAAASDALPAGTDAALASVEQEFPDMLPAVPQEGMLWRKTGMFRKKWKPHFFHYDKERQLLLQYTDQRDRVGSPVELSMATVSCEVDDDLHDTHAGFIVTYPDGKLLLAASSVAERDEWVAELQE